MRSGLSRARTSGIAKARRRSAICCAGRARHRSGTRPRWISIVAWHGAPLGHLTHDGFEWRWKPTDSERTAAHSPDDAWQAAAFHCLAAAGGLARASSARTSDERALLRSGKRYMSNISIVEREAELAALPQDILLTRVGEIYQGRRLHGAICRAGHAA